MSVRAYSREGLLPEVEQVLAASRAVKPPQPHPVETLRSFNEAAAVYFNTGAPDIALEREIVIDAPAGPLRALVFAPVTEPSGLPLILHLHGGGYVFMLPESYAKPGKEIAKAAHAIVVSLDYRLAPEHPYPEPLDDAVAAFRWLRTHAAELGGDPDRIALAGESAGGGLAAATALRVIASGGAPPAAVALSCAWLDIRNSSPSFAALGPDDPMIDSATMAFWRSCYVPRESQWTDPHVSPVLADVSSFPPACVIVGGIDPLHDDGVTFAERLRDAGRHVELHDYDGMPHVFWCYPPLHNLTDATSRVATFLRRHLDSVG